MKITIDISSEEAETMLYALALRAKQSKLSTFQAQNAIDLGKRLNKTFEKGFGWMDFDRMKKNCTPMKRVNITFYDYPPEN